MKVIILCGGLGTRLAEETQIKPKPMVEIGGRPILWHIMKIYERHGITDFSLALGYKGEVIKDYFTNYHANLSDMTVHLKSGKVDYYNPRVEDWSVSMIDTGENTMTGGRLLRLKKYLENNNEPFMLTYGDGVSDVDISALLKFHRSHGKLATVTAVRPSARFGGMDIGEGQVINFKEKPQSGTGWINGGFFVFEPSVFDYLDDDSTILERSPLENLVRDEQLMAYQHSGYWQCMDTIRDRDSLQELWDNGSVPWVYNN
ncbi:glucose-1-phosphate cytidylyltransferase [Candidatus Pseudothioglobus singularis]|jgi:glucose-1-phosphate cytidylyltransferase|nr:glucose-1-phosphate cytidylyltransferase [Candidatus Pseudothioglobus singularis]